MKKILIVEFSDHFRIISHLFQLLSHYYDVYLFIKRDAHLVEGIPVDKKWVIRSENFLYWKLLFKGFFYSWIYLSTGPEYRQYNKNLFFLVGFFFFSWVHGKKIILQIRNLDQYVAHNNACYTLRYKALCHIQRVVLDSQQIQQNFHTLFPFLRCKTSVIGFYYTDFLKNIPLSKTSTSKIKIGLIGIDSTRKDYALVYKALEQVDTSSLELVVVGDCLYKQQYDVIEKFREIITVTVQENKQLTDDEFMTIALSCDVFLSPLRDSFGYGVTKETGNFGDALLYQKKIIIPQFACVSNEFDALSFYYTTGEELVVLLQNMIVGTFDLSIPASFLDEYSSKAVFSRLKKELFL